MVAAEQVLEQARQRGHEAELAVAAAAARAEEHGPPPADDPGDVDPEAERSRIEDLERRRRMMGNVNLLAAEELEEMQGRLTEIGEQVADLEAASESLRAHMAGLDSTVADGFEELFGAVQARFSDNIATLFPGGHGRLAEVEGEDDEPGIEVQVVPAGKRPRPLSMLSGGERSLVALAFCMAIAMCKPAPFYLLDEVEAALDDTNLRRFLALVRQLSDHTQFLMITHQQPTVEIADTLFGVTMGQDGVSQVVARRLDRTLEGRARPFVRRQLKAIQGGRA
ncbi:MAG: AAA family ATPase [Thermoleophilia bacterium]